MAVTDFHSPECRFTIASQALSAHCQSCETCQECDECDVATAIIREHGEEICDCGAFEKFSRLNARAALLALLRRVHCPDTREVSSAQRRTISELTESTIDQFLSDAKGILDRTD